MTAETILKMIESVDPADTAKLDEIDARAECFLYGALEGLMLTNGYESFWYSIGVLTRPVKVIVPKYTRSRDALKNIRPKGYTWSADFTISEDDAPGFGGHFSINKRGQRFFSHCKTEELAELHAIIQAISHERSNEETGNAQD